MKRLTFWTFLRCFQRRERMSHFSGVLMMMLPLPSSFRSVLVSPVSKTTFLLRRSWNFSYQSKKTWRERKNAVVNLKLRTNPARSLETHNKISGLEVGQCLFAPSEGPQLIKGL